MMQPCYSGGCVGTHEKSPWIPFMTKNPFLNFIHILPCVDTKSLDASIKECFNTKSTICTVNTFSVLLLIGISFDCENLQCFLILI